MNNIPLWATELDGNGGSATFPTCVFFDSSGVQQDPPVSADSLTLIATTTKQSLTDIVLTACRLVNSDLLLGDIETWKSKNNIVGMRSAAITGNPCDVYGGAEQTTTPVYTLAVGQRGYFGVLPREAYPGGEQSGAVDLPACVPFTMICDGTDENLISASARRLMSADLFHINDAPIYARFYDKATAPDENDTPIHTVGAPANATAANGAGSNKPLPPGGLQLTNGLGIRVVKGIAVTNDTAVDTAEVIVNASYRT